MKRNLIYILFIFTIFISNSFIVKAQDLLTKNEYTIKENNETLNMTTNKDSYLTININNDNTLINIYNNKNELLSSKQINDLLFSNILKYNENYLVYGKKNNIVSLYVLDSNLKISSSKDTEILVDNSCKINIYFYNEKIYLLLTDEGTLYDNKLYEIDTNLNITSKNISSYDNSELVSILKSDYYLIHSSATILDGEVVYYLSSDYIEKYSVIAGYSSHSVVRLLDETGTELWTKINQNYQAFLNVKIINNKIVLLALNNNIPYLVIYNMAGEIEKEIKVSEKNYDSVYLNKTNNNIAIILNELETNETTNESTTSSEIITYNYKNTINLNAEEYGTIEVAKEAEPYEEVKLNIVPNSGYKVASIIIKDEKGNEISINDNVFIMPESSVYITVAYSTLLINPETADFITIIIILFVLSIIFTRIIYKKLKWLN